MEKSQHVAATDRAVGEGCLKIGAVQYLNTRPLIAGLARADHGHSAAGNLLPGSSLDTNRSTAPANGGQIELKLDLPSRLADQLAAGQLDVALIPSVEFFHGEDYQLVSDACIACRGPVWSVKLYFRVPPAEVRTLALDEGSRTSCALARILLAELHGVTPDLESLPIGQSAQSVESDAVLLIGDRAMHDPQGEFVEVWDLGDRWCRWSELPFVFAAWVARDEATAAGLASVLSASRDLGYQQLPEIAAREAPRCHISTDQALRYLRENLYFRLGPRELAGLTRFYQLCCRHGLAPVGRESRITLERCDDCHSL